MSCIIYDKSISDFMTLVMQYTKRRKREVLEIVRKIPGFKKEFVINWSAQCFESHVEEWADGWAQSDLADGRPSKPLHKVWVPYGNTPSVMLFDRCPKEDIEKTFPEAIVRSTMEA